MEPGGRRTETEDLGFGGRLHVFGAAEHARESAAWVARRMRRAAAYRDRATVALSGQSVLRPVCDALAAARGLPWRRVEIYFADGGARGAEAGGDLWPTVRVAREALLSRVPVSEDRIHLVDGDGAPEDEARRYGELLPDRLDLMLLELGEDGGLASLTPGSPAFRSERRVVPVPESAAPGAITVTPRVLDSARAVAVLARGEERSSAVARALASDGGVEECPARLARGAHWLLDDGAAAGLQRRQD